MGEAFKHVKFKSLGDSAVMVQIGDSIDPTNCAILQNLLALLEDHPFDGFAEAVPAYTNITIYYHPYTVFRMTGNITSYDFVCQYVKQLMTKMTSNKQTTQRVVEIPVVYGGEYGPDLEYVAKRNGLTTEEVIQLHSANECLVYMLGFAPGFAFMGGMNEAIATSRKDTPRLAIPARSVGIAGKQTGIYPFETPGGWQIIGRTPLDLFLPKETPPSLLQAGDCIRFKPISDEEYKQLKETRS
nr:5-oxoprolinase subunit PxpB [Viridibacillus soli]